VSPVSGILTRKDPKTDYGNLNQKELRPVSGLTNLKKEQAEVLLRYFLSSTANIENMKEIRTKVNQTYQSCHFRPDMYFQN